MKDELQPCPFCGNTNTQITRLGKTKARVYCGSCGASNTQRVLYYSVDWLLEAMPKSWNTRPIEDKLLAQLAERDELIKRLVEAGDYLAAFGSLRKWLVATKELRAMKGGEG